MPCREKRRRMYSRLNGNVSLAAPSALFRTSFLNYLNTVSPARTDACGGIFLDNLRRQDYSIVLKHGERTRVCLVPSPNTSDGASFTVYLIHSRASHFAASGRHYVAARPFISAFHNEDTRKFA